MPGIIGVHQLRFPKDDKMWRPSTRQDVFSQPRFYIWKPQLPPVYASQNNPLLPAAMPINYNRYGLTPVPSMLHHPNHLFTMPKAKVNNYQYWKMKDLTPKSKPGHMHHITIFNAIMPRQYIPVPTVAFHKSQQVPLSHRNNKQLYYYQMHMARPTADVGRTRSPSPQQNSNAIRANDVLHTTSKPSNPVQTDNEAPDVDISQCGHTHLGPIASNAYCSTLKYFDNAANKRETKLQEVRLPTPAPTNALPSTERSLKDVPLFIYSSPKPIFLPTIYNPPVNYSSETSTKNSNKIEEYIQRTTPTTPLGLRGGSHEHNFFTIEDAITNVPPQNYVFNNPYDALSHARRQKERVSKLKIASITNKETVSNRKRKGPVNSFDNTADNNYLLYNQAPNKYKRDEFNTKRDRNPLGQLYSTEDPFRMSYTTSFVHGPSDKSTTTTLPYLYEASTGNQTTPTEVANTTPITISSTEAEENKLEKTVAQTTSEVPVITTPTNLYPTAKRTIKTSRLKLPFYGRSVAPYTTQKTSVGLFKALENLSSSSAPTAASKKKPHKYRRQYKPKKVKIFKTALSTIAVPVSTTKATTTTTTTKGVHNTKKAAYRTAAVTASSARATTTKASNVNSEKSQTNREVFQRQKNSRRSEKGRNKTTEKSTSNKSRRRVFTSSTTPKPHTTSSYSVSAPSTVSTALPSTAITTKSTTRKSTAEPNAKLLNGRKSPKTTQNEIDQFSSEGLKHSTRHAAGQSSKYVSVPPLPIEIYFQNTQKHLTASDQ